MPGNLQSCFALGCSRSSPTEEEEAVRDLCRARDDAREDLQRGRHRLGKLLLPRYTVPNENFVLVIVPVEF